MSTALEEAGRPQRRQSAPPCPMPFLFVYGGWYRLSSVHPPARRKSVGCHGPYHTAPSAPSSRMMAALMNDVLLLASLETIDVSTRVQTALMMQAVAEPYIRMRAAH